MSIEKFTKIESSKNWLNVEKINQGWSQDIKYIVETQDNEKMILRTSKIELYDKRKKQYENLKLLTTLSEPISQVKEFGILDHQNIYMILSYLDGSSARDIISELSNFEAYQLGVEAGAILKAIHSTKITKPNETWYQSYLKKIARKIDAFFECPLDIPNKEIFINYIRENLFLMEDRPLVLCHGDYHLGNMIINNNKIGIIDFDKCSIADPYDEFKPFCWNVFESEYFASALINSYFHNQIPKDFFPILAFYACEVIISHLPWAFGFGEEEVTVAFKVMNAILNWFDNFTICIPKWYKSIS